MNVIKSILGLLALMFVIMVVQAYWEGSHPQEVVHEPDPCRAEGVNFSDCIDNEISAALIRSKH